MTEQMQLAIAVAMLTLVLLYIVWARIRVILLREQLFKVRDHLWDEAERLNGLEDPAYKVTRERLHVLIRYAHHIDLPTAVYALAKQSNSSRLELSRSEDADLQLAIDNAMLSTAKRLLTYLLVMRFSGLLPLLALLPLALVESTRKSIFEFAKRGLGESWPTGLGMVLQH